MNEIAEKCAAVVDGKWSITASKLVTLVKLHIQSDNQTLDIAEVRNQNKIWCVQPCRVIPSACVCVGGEGVGGGEGEILSPWYYFSWTTACC